MTLAPMVVTGVLAGALALGLVVFLLLAPAREEVGLDRLMPGRPPAPTGLSRLTSWVTEQLERLLRRRTDIGVHMAVLEGAGITMPLQEVVLLVIVGALLAGGLGLFLAGPLLGALLLLVFPVAVRGYLSALVNRRKKQFADQLDESLQLIASSLRAGQSLMQALASVSAEAPEPTAGEFARIINETRVGRPLAPALEETASRMGSEDFSWVTQAIAINREVGGTLAEVLDGVGHTIRERSSIRRQVKALAAEGKLSAYILMALPLGIAGFLLMANPAYMMKFTASIVGYILIALAFVLLVVGALWLRKVVSITF